MVAWLLDQWENLIAFFETGGDVLMVIFGVTLMMWALIIERYVYLHKEQEHYAGRLLFRWQGRTETKSWYARQMRAQLVSLVKQDVQMFLPMINSLIALCPLLGLLGTVTGMIEVFDVMAAADSGNPRAMAAGVSRATIPTMAGMVAALSGLYFSARLTRRAAKATIYFEDKLA